MTAVWDKKNRTVTLTETSADEVLKVLLGLSDGSPEVVDLLHQILATQQEILVNEQEMAQALADIDAASTEQGESLTQIASSQDNIAADLEAFINKPVPPGGPSDAQVAQTKALVERAKAIAASLKAQAKFSTDLAGKTEGGTVVIPEVPPVVEPPNPAG